MITADISPCSGNKNKAEVGFCDYCSTVLAAGKVTPKKLALATASLLLLIAPGWGTSGITIPGRVQNAITANKELFGCLEKAGKTITRDPIFAEAGWIISDAESLAHIGKYPEAYSATGNAGELITGLINKLALKNKELCFEEIIVVAKAQADREIFEAETKAAKARSIETRRQAILKEMTLIPAGEFLMGSPENEGSADEHPRHKVYLDAYYIGKHEVTVGQYNDYAKDIGREMREQPSWSTDSHPVVNVDWNGAEDYCVWAGGRLPIEAEWEKAARGGTNTIYSFGDEESNLGEYAYYSDNSNSHAHPVGQKRQNQYGLYDMNGNVWEWVSDWYDEYYYSRSPGKNPEGPGSGSSLGLRGGSWDSNRQHLHTALRSMVGPDHRDNDVGLRCVIPARGSKQ